jgi:hypothetical protein
MALRQVIFAMSLPATLLTEENQQLQVPPLPVKRFPTNFVAAKILLSKLHQHLMVLVHASKWGGRLK